MSTQLSLGRPMIYTGRSAVDLVSVEGRLIAVAIAATCLAVLLTAVWLSPNTGGFGTHRQLGLAECGFLLRTGLPCPACGMTTSFAYFVRGNLAASFYVQPMGCLLAAASGMCVWGAGYVAATGKPVYRVLRIVPEKWFLIPLFTLAIVAWAWKIYIHLHGVDGWR